MSSSSSFQPSPQSRSSSNNNEDLPIMATADDALQAKLATVQAGYYQDAFLQEMSSSSRATTRNRRSFQPIIKRGTHARVCVMDRALCGFLSITASATATQIVVLGAGKDTTYFRLQRKSVMGQQEQQQAAIHWYEVDHDAIIQEKAGRIQESAMLSQYAPILTKTATNHGYHSKVENSSNSSSSSSYHLVGHDLREAPSVLLEKLDLDPSLPTLFLMECVSMYLPLESSKSLLQAIAGSANRVYLTCYEPILHGISNNRSPVDPFGQMMQQNLVKAKVATPDCCLLQTTTLPEQLDKLVECNFDRAVGCDMWSAYQTILSQAQRTRANQCELLDEYEEWIMIMQHYCFVVGVAAVAGRTNEQQNTENDENDAFTGVAQPQAKELSSLLGFVAGKCTQVP